jgi:hypothetical protein
MNKKKITKLKMNQSGIIASKIFINMMIFIVVLKIIY